MLALLASAGLPDDGFAEVRPSGEEWKKLGTFESHVLGKADEVFWEKKDYKRAAAEYDSFILEFPESAAVPYALLQKGRCLQRVEKRFEAIREYRDLLDYFPNTIKYAAAASFYIGQCHWDNGDEEKALTQWAKLARDEDYARQPLAAGAINKLADFKVKAGEADAAVKYYTQVAGNFRRTSADEARYAMDKAMYHHVRRHPDEGKLRALYKTTQGFDHHPRQVDKAEDDRRYWEFVRDRVYRWSDFSDVQKDQRNRYFEYWAKAVGDRFGEWDEMRLSVADWQRQADGDQEAYIKRVDAQFNRGDTADFNRVLRWVTLYKSNKAKWTEYYNKLNYSKMTHGQIVALMRVLYDEVRDNAMAVNAYGKLNLSKMSDGDKNGLARYLWHKDGKLVERTYAAFEDKMNGRYQLLGYYHWRNNLKAALPLADELVKEPRFANGAMWMKAELLQRSKQYEQAIATYQQCDRPPESLQRIVDCYVALGKLNRAVAQLREIEGFFKDHSSWASLKIAHLYRNAGMKDKYIAELRALMKKYPGTSQQSDAHNELEKMGIRIGGGMDAE